MGDVGSFGGAVMEMRSIMGDEKDGLVRKMRQLRVLLEAVRRETSETRVATEESAAALGTVRSLIQSLERYHTRLDTLIHDQTDKTVRNIYIYI